MGLMQTLQTGCGVAGGVLPSELNTTGTGFAAVPTLESEMMKTRYLSAWLLSLLSSAVWATEPLPQSAGQAEVKPDAIDIPLACGVPVYPKNASKLGMEGNAIVKMVADTQGKLSTLEILRSSGWRILDAELITHLQKCTMNPAPATPQGMVVKYKWMLESDANWRGYQGPKLIAESCPKSELVHLADDKEPGIGIVVGVLVSRDASVRAAAVQWDQGAELDQEALRVAKQCQFTAAYRRGRHFDGGIGLRFLPNQDATKANATPVEPGKSQP